MKIESFYKPDLTQSTPQYREVLLSENGPLAALHAFALDETPRFNNQNREQAPSQDAIDTYIIEVNRRAVSLKGADIGALEPRDLLKVHTALTLAISSAEFWEEGACGKLEPAINTALEIGDRFTPELGPWLTTAGYYIYVDPENPYTFTGSKDEKVFIQLSREAALRYADAVTLTQAFAFDGTREDVVRIEQTTTLLDDIGKVYRSFKDQVNPETFFQYFRKLSFAHSIHGKLYPSKSIATNPWARAFDTQMYGLSQQDSVYSEDTQTRMKGKPDINLASSMVGFDTTILQASLAGTTLPHKLGEILGIAVEDLLFSQADFHAEMATINPDEFDLKRLRQMVSQKVAEKMSKLLERRPLEDIKHQIESTGMTETILLIRELYRRAGEVSAVHSGLVHTYVTAQRRKSTTEDDKKGSQYGTHGLGGLPIARVQLLSAIRQHSPLLKLLEKL
ncbi:MAG: hypothetical protein ACEQSA_00720 [Weeksellaceae bacterium]